MLRRLKATLDANVDYGAAAVAATLLGTIVFAINRSHGTGSAATAALKQATYTFFVAGFIVKNNERLARKLTTPAWSIALAAVVSSCLRHRPDFPRPQLEGTAEPARRLADALRAPSFLCSPGAPAALNRPGASEDPPSHRIPQKSRSACAPSPRLGSEVLSIPTLQDADITLVGVRGSLPHSRSKR